MELAAYPFSTKENYSWYRVLLRVRRYKAFCMRSLYIFKHIFSSPSCIVQWNGSHSLLGSFPMGGSTPGWYTQSSCWCYCSLSVLDPAAMPWWPCIILVFVDCYAEGRSAAVSPCRDSRLTGVDIQAGLPLGSLDWLVWCLDLQWGRSEVQIHENGLLLRSSEMELESTLFKAGLNPVFTASDKEL